MKTNIQNVRIREYIELQIDNASSIQTDNLNEEDIAVESWNRKSKTQRTTKSYLEVNPHLTLSSTVGYHMSH